MKKTLSLFHMFMDVLKGFLVGICASVPLGPIAILVIQKSLNEGHKTGFLTALGACLLDTIYAAIAIFALAIAQKFVGEHETPILIVGGLIVTGIGLGMSFNDPFRKVKEEKPSTYSMRDFLRTAIMSLSNPGAILAIFAMFAFFGLEPQAHDFSVAMVILAVGLGSATYWFFFSWFFSHLRKNFDFKTMLWINRVSGILIMIIGIALFAEGLLKVIFH